MAAQAADYRPNIEFLAEIGTKIVNQRKYGRLTSTNVATWFQPSADRLLK